MRDTIEIEKDLLPYEFNILLGAEEFNLELKYNEKADLFTCTLSKDDNVLVYDEPLIYGKPLFSEILSSDEFPCLSLVPYDESGLSDSITYDNFGVSVFLTVDEDGDADE